MLLIINNKKCMNINFEKMLRGFFISGNGVIIILIPIILFRMLVGSYIFSWFEWISYWIILELLVFALVYLVNEYIKLDD